jgi:hypothetical protein
MITNGQWGVAERRLCIGSGAPQKGCSAVIMAKSARSNGETDAIDAKSP